MLKQKAPVKQLLPEQRELHMVMAVVQAHAHVSAACGLLNYYPPGLEEFSEKIADAERLIEDYRMKLNGD